MLVMIFITDNLSFGWIS